MDITITLTRHQALSLMGLGFNAVDYPMRAAVQKMASHLDLDDIEQAAEKIEKALDAAVNAEHPAAQATA